MSLKSSRDFGSFIPYSISSQPELFCGCFRLSFKNLGFEHYFLLPRELIWKHVFWQKCEPWEEGKRDPCSPGSRDPSSLLRVPVPSAPGWQHSLTALAEALPM